eukprot:1159083-Pelagomonas_calceolata.AAC.1
MRVCGNPVGHPTVSSSGGRTLVLCYAQAVMLENQVEGMGMKKARILNRSWSFAHMCGDKHHRLGL